MSRPEQQHLVRGLEAGVRAVKELAQEGCLWRAGWEGVLECSTGGFPQIPSITSQVCKPHCLGFPV